MSTYNHQFDISLVREAIKLVESWRALAFKLGLPYPSSIIYRRLRPFCSQHGIDYSHFKGMLVSKGKKCPERMRPIEDYLNNDQSINSHDLKKKLIQRGLKQHRCEKCENIEWNSRPIPIQLHHKDGNSANNALDNLQILCPNCHAQTENYCSKNRKQKDRAFSSPVPDEAIVKAIPYSENPSQVLRQVGLSLAQGHYDRIKRLVSSNPELKFKANARVEKKTDPYWRIKSKPDQRKVERPTSGKLHELVWAMPSIAIAKSFGVSDSAIKKWCDSYGIDKPPRGYWAKHRTKIGATNQIRTGV